MKFNKWSKLRIELGLKIITSRKQKSLSDPDVQYIVGPLPWKFIRDYLYNAEGAESPEELQKVINKIFRRVVKDDEPFFVHVLIIPKKLI